jgi:hypothetical protein
MKSGVAAVVVAAVEHASTPHRCRGVQVVLTAGEETGCTGLLGLDASARAALAGGGPIVVAEPTGNELVLGHKGAHWMRLRAAGRSAHGGVGRGRPSRLGGRACRAPARRGRGGPAAVAGPGAVLTGVFDPPPSAYPGQHRTDHHRRARRRRRGSATTGLPTPISVLREL